MAVVKRIVCLAKSRMYGGNCIAGREIGPAGPGDWIRPVSIREHQEILDEECRFQMGRPPRLLDQMDVPIRQHRPHRHQTENWLIETREKWEWAGHVDWTDLGLYAEKSGQLWHNGCSTSKGINDQIPSADMANLTSSLKLIHVDKFLIRLLTEGADYGTPRQRIQAEFDFAGISYRLKVTDPAMERKYLRGVDGRFAIGESYLTISLAADDFFGYYYKLVAAVIMKVS